MLNVAVTALLWFMITVQVLPLGLSQPDHEVSVHPGSVVAVRVTEVPLA
jgi:predicted secreted protein